MPQQPTTVLIHPASPSWHRHLDCQALDTATIHGGRTKQIPADQAADRRPCLVCADDATEWVLTEDNAYELWELIDASKPRFGADPVTGQTVPNGLTITIDGVRVWARYGDTIRLGRNGRATVTHAVLQEA